MLESMKMLRGGASQTECSLSGFASQVINGLLKLVS